MKRHNNLWDKFISVENLENAADKAIRSKKNKKSTKKFLANRPELMQKLRDSLINGTFNTSPYRIFTIYEPKKRDIYELPLYPDHIVHHALINIMGPIWQKMFIHDSYACIPNRGLHAASQRIMTFVRRNKYCLQCDVRKFFPSINHGIMMNVLRKKISDKKILNLFDNIVWSVGGNTNLPIGNLTSQWLGNVYLHELDMFVKQCLHCRDYLRYCDDFCLFGDNKKQLWIMKNRIAEFLSEKLKLVLSKVSLRRTTDGINIIGYRHFCKFILLRRQSMHKIKRRLLNIVKYNDHSDLAVGQLASAKGWLKWACTYNFRQSVHFI